MSKLFIGWWYRKPGKMVRSKENLESRKETLEQLKNPGKAGIFKMLSSPRTEIPVAAVASDSFDSPASKIPRLLSTSRKSYNYKAQKKPVSVFIITTPLRARARSAAMLLLKSIRRHHDQSKMHPKGLLPPSTFITRLGLTPKHRRDFQDLFLAMEELKTKARKSEAALAEAKSQISQDTGKLNPKLKHQDEQLKGEREEEGVRAMVWIL
ncbi:uncharacterized protein PAC_03991 [Phialocephala subalpina]|uniref:Uncharacterized protein n=1 Tax=Phialocephala subalpina TaxID=576137 RepID=A0A1L7WMY6_9HELO|nr:uncharacterized protein PAC_03991 [Phialocephala subalpina]